MTQHDSLCLGRRALVALGLSYEHLDVVLTYVDHAKHDDRMEPARRQTLVEAALRLRELRDGDWSK